MATPPSPLLHPPHHPYGDFRAESADGRYWFEWTPFTPAIVAWRNAARRLASAHQRLLDAGKITGFAIRGLETDHRRFLAELKVIAADVEEAHRQATVVINALEEANQAYAASSDASYEQYQRLVGVIDNTLLAQGRGGEIPGRSPLMPSYVAPR